MGRLGSVAAIYTPEGVETLTAYANFVIRKHNFRPPEPFERADLVQAGLAYVFRYVPQWDEDGASSLDNWATETLKYGMLDFMRGARWRKQHQPMEGRELSAWAEGEMAQRLADPVNIEADAMLADEIDVRLSVLNDGERGVIEGLLAERTMKQIALELGVPMTTADYYRISAARKLGLIHHRPVHRLGYRSLSAARKKTILARYKNGPMESAKGIADDLHISKESVLQVIREGGVSDDDIHARAEHIRLAKRAVA